MLMKQKPGTDRPDWEDHSIDNRTVSTVQDRPSENKIVFGLKVPSGDGLGLILSLK